MTEEFDFLEEARLVLEASGLDMEKLIPYILNTAVLLVVMTDEELLKIIAPSFRKACNWQSGTIPVRFSTVA